MRSFEEWANDQELDTEMAAAALAWGTAAREALEPCKHTPPVDVPYVCSDCQAERRRALGGESDG